MMLVFETAAVEDLVRSMQDIVVKKRTALWAIDSSLPHRCVRTAEISLMMIKRQIKDSPFVLVMCAFDNAS